MTLIPFAPQANVVFTFNPVLDGVTYVANCTWNIYAQRYYVSIFDTARTLIVYQPLIGSPPDYDINLVFGYFSSTLVYRVVTGNFEVTP